MNKEILIKFGELFLKGENRSKFEDSLLHNLRDKIGKYGNFDIRKMGSVYSISGNNLDKIMDEIGKVFGISSYCLSNCVNKNLDEIKKTSLKEVENSQGKTFKIKSKRADKKFYLNSIQICNEVGQYICEHSNLSVDVHNPDLLINIEIRDKSYIYSKTFNGLGGLPVGTSGLGTVMISGGIDSPVASFMMAKRGLRINAIHFSTPPYTSERSVDKVKRILKKISEYSGKIKLFIVNFTNIQKNIKISCAENLTTIISRRLMNKISERICFVEKSSCIITGESLGQVASQTLSSINCTGHDIKIPIFRPLIGLDKSEIVEIARNIGTFEISIEDFDDCCSIFSPKSPKINPILKFVELEENKIKEIDKMIDEAINNCEICEIG